MKMEITDQMIASWSPERMAAYFEHEVELCEAAESKSPRACALAKLEMHGGTGLMAFINGASIGEITSAKNAHCKLMTERQELKEVFPYLPSN